jgi:hypothetical protein
MTDQEICEVIQALREQTGLSRETWKFLKDGSCFHLVDMLDPNAAPTPLRRSMSDTGHSIVKWIPNLQQIRGIPTDIRISWRSWHFSRSWWVV